MRGLFIVVRILGAAAIIAAIVTQLTNNYSYWRNDTDISNFSSLPVNFFSYFTIDSNVFTVVVFLVGAVLLIRKVGDPKGFAIFRACTTSYMAVTGIVYNTLLRGVDVPLNLVVPWTNEVLHVVGPLLIVLDYLFAPGRRRLEWTTIWWIVSFPIVWAIYTMIRGPIAYNELAQKPTWYPYPFLDPSLAPEGYVSVGFYVVLIAAVIGGVGVAVVAISRRHARWPLPAASAAPARS